MEKQTTLNWRSESKYVDIETGEMITKEEAIKSYIIKQTKTKTNVIRTTGYKYHTHECWRSRQTKLFE